MKYGWLRRALILLVALNLCAAMVLYSRERPEPELRDLTVWYVESDFPSAAVHGLTERCREAGIRLKTVAYKDEAYLSAAFEGLTGGTGARPDLLYCGHTRAAQLEERDGLAAIAEPLPVPDSLAQMRPAIGKRFFPIGFRLPVLLVNKELTDADFDSLEELLAAAGESPFLGCECWAALMYTELAAQGIQLPGLPEEDLKDPAVAALYNSLARGVFRGGIVTAEDAAAYVRQGLLPCAAVDSVRLGGLTDAKLDVQLLPLPDGVELRYPAELMGFALLDGADTDTAADFFFWLWTGKSAETAMEAGLLPFAQVDAELHAGGELGRRLNELSGNTPLFLMDADEPFVRNRAGFERGIREALDLLT